MELADTPADTLRFIVVARTLGISKYPPGLAVTAAIARRPAICGTLLRLYTNSTTILTAILSN